MKNLVVAVALVCVSFCASLASAEEILNSTFGPNVLSEHKRYIDIQGYAYAMNSLKAMIPGNKEAPQSFIQGDIRISVNDVILGKLKKIVGKKLRDPYSAQYEEIRVMAYGAEHTVLLVCGLVNGKNAYGAYAGRQSFLAILTNPHIDNVEAQKQSHFSLDPWAAQVCTDMGLR